MKRLNEAPPTVQGIADALKISPEAVKEYLAQNPDFSPETLISMLQKRDAADLASLEQSFREDFEDRSDMHEEAGSPEKETSMQEGNISFQDKKDLKSDADNDIFDKENSLSSEYKAIYFARKGRTGKQKRLRELAYDDKLSSDLRGSLLRDINAIKKGKRKTIRVPPGYELAHRMGYSAHKGYSYAYADLRNIDLHRLQHRHLGYKY